MHLTSLLNGSLIKVRMKAESREEVVSQLLDEIFAHHLCRVEREKVEAALAAREALGSTVLPGGLAIPHARIDGFDDLVIALGVPKSAIETEDGKVSLFVLILNSKTGSNLYLNCLSAFVKISKDREIFGRLLSAGHSSEFLEILQGLNIDVKPELTVESIMTVGPVSVVPETSVKDVINLLSEKHFSYLPVIDKSGDFVGEVNVLEIFRLGIPNYAQMIGNMNFLKSFEPLEDLLEREAAIKVKDIMESPSVVFKKDTSLVEAVFAFTKTKRRQIPVVEGNKILGVLSYIDILTKVLRA